MEMKNYKISRLKANGSKPTMRLYIATMTGSDCIHEQIEGNEEIWYKLGLKKWFG